MSRINSEKPFDPLSVVREQLATAADAQKCHRCGCFQQTVEAIARTGLAHGDLGPALTSAKSVFKQKEYDCLGCPVCFPAVAAGAFEEAFPDAGAMLNLCPTEEPPERGGWPPLPGDYYLLRHRAPVAICTLNSDDLARRIVARRPENVAIVGTLRTENLGIERIIRNVLANRHIRFLLLCGEDTQQAVGHLPGQSFLSLSENGIDDRGRICGARGKRPVLNNVGREQIEMFCRDVEVVPLIGDDCETAILEQVKQCSARNPGPRSDGPADITVPVIIAEEPRRLIPDSVGFLVVYPDAARRRLVVEHYTTEGVLDVVLEGSTSSALYATAIERGLLTRLDHAAYLGQELARAQQSMETGETYVQDRAPGETDPPAAKNGGASCSCGSGCESGGPS